jgi:hypothetical protein
MKKKLFLLFTIIGLLFLFTGCGAILEALYPDYTGEGGGRAVVVNIRFDDTQFFDENDAAPVKVRLVPFQHTSTGLEIDLSFGSDEVNLYRNQFEFDSNANVYTAQANFDHPGYAIYRAIVWFDVQTNGLIGYEEPAMEAVHSGSGMVDIDLTYYKPGDPPIEMEAVLDRNTYVDSSIVDAMLESGGGESGDNQPPVAQISMDNSWVFPNTQVEFRGWNSYDNEGPIQEYSWTIQDTYGPQPFQGDSCVYTFRNVGRWSVRLEVRDNDGVWSETMVFIDVIEEQTGTNKQVEVGVEVDSSVDLNSTLRVVLLQTDVDGHFDMREFWNQRYPTALFEWIPDGEYIVAGWLDLNENGMPDSGEPGDVAYPYNAPDDPSIWLDSGTEFVEVYLYIDLWTSIPEEYLPDQAEGEGSPDNPMMLDLGVSHDAFVERNATNYYSFDVIPNRDYSVHLFNMDANNDLDVYENWEPRFWGYYLNGSYNGGPSDEWVTVMVVDEFLLVEVSGYDGGNYTLEVSEETGGGGPPEGSPDNPEMISLGSPVGGYLPTDGFMEWFYAVEVDANTDYVVELYGLDVDVDVQVFQNWEPRLNFNNGLGGGYNSDTAPELVNVTPNTDYLIIKVYTWDPSNFTLEVYEDTDSGPSPLGSPNNPEQISLNSPVSGFLSTDGKWFYAIPVDYGFDYTVELYGLDADVDVDVYENWEPRLDMFYWIDGSWNYGTDPESITVTAYDDYLIIEVYNWDPANYTLEVYPN